MLSFEKFKTAFINCKLIKSTELSSNSISANKLSSSIEFKVSVKQSDPISLLLEMRF